MDQRLSNKAVIAGFFDDLRTETVRKELLDVDIEWSLAGEMPFSGTHIGYKAVFGMWRQIAQLLEPGSLEVEVLTLLADDDQVVAETHSLARTVTGQRYSGFYCYVFTIRDGLITRAHQYLDTQYAARIHGFSRRTEDAAVSSASTTQCGI